MILENKEFSTFYDNLIHEIKKKPHKEITFKIKLRNSYLKQPTWKRNISNQSLKNINYSSSGIKISGFDEDSSKNVCKPFSKLRKKITEIIEDSEYDNESPLLKRKLSL